MPSKINLDVERIKTLYYDEKKSFRKIAKILGCSSATVANRLRENGLKTRSKSEGQKLIGAWRSSQMRIDLDLKEIVRLYFEERLTTKEVGDRLGVSAGVVYRRLKDAGYQLRTLAMRRINVDIAELVRLYFEEHLSLMEISLRLDISPDPIRKRLVEAGYQLRTVREAKVLQWKKKKARQAAQSAPQQVDLASVPEGTIEDKILFLRDSQNAKVQDIAHTLKISPVAVYDVIMESR